MIDKDGAYTRDGVEVLKAKLAEVTAERDAAVALAERLRQERDAVKEAARLGRTMFGGDA